MGNRIRVLIVDDSALMRKALKEIMLTDVELDVIGTARDGQDAIVKVRELQPDVITMDINMPVMDGLTSMQYILSDYPEIPILIISSLSQDGALTTFEALALGAYDYVSKPSGTVSSNIHIVGKEIINKVKQAYKGLNRIATKNRANNYGNKLIQRQRQKMHCDTQNISINQEETLSKVVVIGVSTGGPGTLMEVIPYLPHNLKAALIVVQHMPPTFTSSFANRLAQSCAFPFKEVEPGDVLANGRGYLARGGYHLVVHRNSNMLRINTSPNTQFMPSVNVTMESILERYGGKNVVGVIMTGMGNDGAEAMVKIRKAGGVTIAEDESTAIVFGMPKETIARGGAEIVVPSYQIADEIVKAVNRK